MISLDALIHQAQSMKPLPASVVRLAALVSSDQTDLEDICEVIAYDQALTLTLLRAANSAADAGANEISNVADAVFRLGGPRVLALALSANTEAKLPAFAL